MLDNLVQTILQVKSHNRVILGLDGLSRAGKTTLVTQISNRLEEKGIPTYIFHLDDLIVEREKRYGTGREEWFEYYYLQWNTKLLHAIFFGKLKESNELQLPFYDDRINKIIERKVSLPSEGIIIVEGIFLQRAEWRKFFDYVVFLDCPRAIRFSRESSSTQQNVEKFRKRYWRAEDYYMQTETPLNKADLVITCSNVISRR